MFCQLQTIPVLKLQHHSKTPNKWEQFKWNWITQFSQTLLETLNMLCSKYCISFAQNAKWFTQMLHNTHKMLNGLQEMLICVQETFFACKSPTISMYMCNSIFLRVCKITTPTHQTIENVWVNFLSTSCYLNKQWLSGVRRS